MWEKMNIGILTEKLKLTYWVLPTLAVFLTLFFLWLALLVPNDFMLSMNQFLFSTQSAEAARDLLATIGASLMTVIGVLTSLSVIVLQQASAQFSPRVIENFVRSPSHRIMLGTYIGTFLCCVFLMRLIPIDADRENLPLAGISFAVLLGIVCTAFLIHYVNHLVESIKSTTIIREIKQEGEVYQKRYIRFIHDHTLALPKVEGRGNRSHIRAQGSGYLQSFNPEKLANCLNGDGAHINIEKRPGDYVYEGDTLALLLTSRPPSKERLKQLAEFFTIGDARTHVQDLRYAPQQLVDIALRALSPGINDQSTAIEALNAIGSLIINFKKLGNHGQVIKVEGVIMNLKRVELEEFLELSLGQILHFGREHPPVLQKAREILKHLCHSPGYDPNRSIESYLERCRGPAFH